MYRRVDVWLLVVMTFLFIVGCSKQTINHHYTFVGENERWKAELIVKGQQIIYEEKGKNKYQNNEDRKFLLTYKGNPEDLSTINHMTYGYRTNAGGASSGIQYDHDSIRETEFELSGSSSGGARIRDHHVIQVYVMMDGEEEHFELRIK